MTRRWVSVALFLAVLFAGLVIRARDLHTPDFWVDEAESSINALTVLKHGYPVDHYLGQPIFENTFVRYWPEHEEYEFKDISYSGRGVAVYHGWLPLYAIAGSFRLHGIQPDEPDGRLVVKHDREAIKVRTSAARVPSVIFGLITLVLLFAAGHSLYGPDAAWAALLAGTFHGTLVELSRQARYYSPTIALSLACFLAVWWMVQRGKWRDFFVGSAVFVLLFHTHTLSFFILSVLCTLTLPMLWSHDRGVWKIVLLGSVVLLGTVPWILLTGFLENVKLAPPARPLLSLAQDLPILIKTRSNCVALYGGIILCLVGVTLLRKRFPDRARTAFLQHKRAFTLLLAWMPIAAVSFVALIPAASYWPDRLKLVLLPSCYLLCAVFVAGIARWLTPVHSVRLAPAIVLLFLVFSGRIASLTPPPSPFAFGPAIDELRQRDLRPGTKLYATPNMHLAFAFQTGLPFQSIAPVRKSYLDAYGGDVLFFQWQNWPAQDADPLSWTGIRQAAEAEGRVLSEAEAKRWESSLVRRIVHEDLAEMVAEVLPPLQEVPPFIRRAIGQQRRLATRRLREPGWIEAIPVLRGYERLNPWDDWQVLYQRFVDPNSRRGSNANYADRLRDATALIFPETGWVLFQFGPVTPEG